MNEIIETDVAVVGAGGCGLTASLLASSHGKRVVLLERDAEVGGNTAMSVGIIVGAGSALQQENGENGSAEELAADIFALNKSQSHAGVTMALCRASGSLIDWLVAQDVPMEHMSGYRYRGMSRTWIHSPPERKGSTITEALYRKVKQQSNIDLHLGTKVIGLKKHGGSINGLEAKTPDGDPLIVSARAIILAASGFGANSELVSRFIPDMTGIPYYGAPYSTGDAIEWGRSMGAAADHMNSYQSHSSIAHPRMMLVTTYLINHGAIQVNDQGVRFGDETDSYAGHALAVQAQPGRSVVELFDERILNQTISDYPRFNECIEAGIVQRAEFLGEMANLFGLAESNLVATVDRYNRAVNVGHDEFGRTRFDSPLTTPYFGIRVTSALVQTLGGLRIDERARVIRPDGSWLTGLYAGGGTAAGLAGDQPEGYLAGTGLLTAFGLGWIAGQDAARLE